MSEKKEISRKIEELLSDCKTGSRNFNYIDNNVTELINVIKGYPSKHGYNYIPLKTKQYYTNIQKEITEGEYVIHQKVLLARLMQNSLEKIDERSFTTHIIEGLFKFYLATTNSLIKDHFSDNFYTYTDDKYLKVQSICNLSTLLINPFLLDKDRVSIRFLKSCNLRQFLLGVYTILFKIKGVSPIYKFHNNQVDFHAMKFFNEDGFRKMFLSVAKLLINNKKVKGVTGTSWFFDPKIRTISPELGYVSELINEIGGEVFKHNSDEKTIKNALFLNKKRKDLYEKGLYHPYNYVLIISRKKLIDWGNKS